jgi:hypothetical protein
MKNLYLDIVCVRLVFPLYFLQIWSFCFVVLFAHSGCHLKVDFPICFSSTHARLCEQHPVPSLGFGSFFIRCFSREHSTGQFFLFSLDLPAGLLLCLVSHRWLLCSSHYFAVGSWFAQHKPRPGRRVLLSSVSVTTAALRFGFFAAVAVRAGSFCRSDFSSVERLASLDIARLPQILLAFGQVLMVKFSSASHQDWTFLCEFCCCFKFFGSCCVSSSCRLKPVYFWAIRSKGLRFSSSNRSETVVSQTYL